MPEKHNLIEVNRANRAKLLFDELTTALKEYKAGNENIGQLSAILNELQRMTYEKLQLEGTIANEVSYDDYAVSDTINDDGKELVYSRLGKLHPVIQEQTNYEFNRLLAEFRLAYPQANFPETGTKSDLYKSTLKHLCGRFSNSLSHATISDVQLHYIQKAELDEDQFIEAHKLIVKGLLM